jgi:hypothetical protein
LQGLLIDFDGLYEQFYSSDTKADVVDGISIGEDFDTRNSELLDIPKILVIVFSIIM